eukprot:TRINITY_DN20832_c0_g1_i1.p1 TRINITY_DN20832_c0_g1~~TRINITY_DN20832_c0_g1_i1.p1  ORF type:complete len:885 (+),score=154.82 TRINITY_DN20832_c0_g1_i1:130-2784(+)
MGRRSDSSRTSSSSGSSSSEEDGLDGGTACGSGEQTPQAEPLQGLRRSPISRGGTSPNLATIRKSQSVVSSDTLDIASRPTSRQQTRQRTRPPPIRSQAVPQTHVAPGMLKASKGKNGELRLDNIAPGLPGAIGGDHNAEMTPSANASHSDDEDDDEEDDEEAVKNFFNASARRTRGMTLKGSVGQRNVMGNVLGRFFAPSGMRNQQSPDHWVLTASKLYPLSAASLKTENGAGCLSKRQQFMNAKATIEKDKARTKRRIEEEEKRLALQGRRGSTGRLNSHFRDKTDPQAMRHEHQLMEPMAKDALSGSSYIKTIVAKMDSHWIHVVQKAVPKKKIGFAAIHNAVSKIKQQVLFASAVNRRNSDQDDLCRSAYQESSSQPLSNAQRMVLQTVFQNYCFRVCGPNRQELMRRSTWFKFLYHCGLLADTVTWSQASAVFALYADESHEPPALTFANWFTALNRLLRGPQFFKNQGEMLKHLMNEYLSRCEEKFPGVTVQRPDVRGPRNHGTAALTNTYGDDASSWVAGADTATSVPPSPRKGSANSVPDALTMTCRELLSTMGQGTASTKATTSAPAPWWQQHPETTGKSSAGVSPQPRLLPGAELAEEQMCEPEVIKCLHEYSAPLKVLFRHFCQKKPNTAGRYSLTQYSEASRNLFPPVQNFFDEFETASEALFPSDASSDEEFEIEQEEEAVHAKPMLRRAMSDELNNSSDDLGGESVWRRSDRKLSTISVGPQGSGGSSSGGSTRKSTRKSTRPVTQTQSEFGLNLRRDMNRNSTIAENLDEDGSPLPPALDDCIVSGENTPTTRSRANVPAPALAPPGKDRMPREHFEAMLKAFDMYPTIVQTYSLHLHIDRSLEKRGLSCLTCRRGVWTRSAPSCGTPA